MPTLKLNALHSRLLASLAIAVSILRSLDLGGRTRSSADGSKSLEGELQSCDGASGLITATLPNGRRMTFDQTRAMKQTLPRGCPFRRSALACS